MTSSVLVHKLHGARNDFIVLDSREQPIENPVALAVRLCDRHEGIGADGLLLIGANGAGISMRVINADGSEAEMCGNGIRCVARYLDERGEGGEHDVATGAGVIHTSVIERGETYQVRVDMGVPRLIGPAAGFPDGVLVDTGNPHLVLFRAALDDVDLAAAGASLQQSAAFPGGVNVHVAVVEGPSTLRVRHYERGAGLTMACGTGAVACAVAARARGVSSPVRVIVPGGELEIELDATGRAFMTGPAVHVFDATI
jgi:diaminopimelate epimerase